MPLTDDKFDQAGPLARSVADLLLFDTALTGDRSLAVASSLKGVRIGISRDDFWSDLDPEVERVCSEALQKLTDAGATLVTKEIREPTRAVTEIARIIMRHDTEVSISAFLEEHGDRLTLEELLERASDDIREGIKAAFSPQKRPSEEQYELALVQREVLRKSIRRYFEELDIAMLAFPPVLIPPPKIGEDEKVELRGRKVSLSHVMARNIKLGSCASMASLVLPAGLTSDGLPVGLEFDALAGNDRELLSLGLLLEQTMGPIPAPHIQSGER
jgi:indoleacetamide hydrolase